MMVRRQHEADESNENGEIDEAVNHLMDRSTSDIVTLLAVISSKFVRYTVHVVYIN